MATSTEPVQLQRLEPERFQFLSSDGLPIQCVKWSRRHADRAVIQISHGLGEHIGRYARFADALVSAGFVVYGNDHRGHGLTAKRGGHVGDFGPGGFDQLVEDMVSLRVIAKNDYPGKPYILLGHSMGSFAAQQFILDHSHSIDGLVLSGSGVLDGLAKVAQGLPSIADVMRLMNASFEPARTPFDWLSRDTAEVNAFIKDPLCFPTLTTGSMESFLNVFPRLSDPREIRKVRPDLPVFIFSGSDDPVGQKLEGVRLLVNRYRDAGMLSVAHEFYPGGRHEMLHETNRHVVFTDLHIWISDILQRTI